ncbi:hypothetical protein DITRI_Ditri01bG0149100 [Diplodiscus trichospermus]
MATTAAIARNLLKNSKSLPQILRDQTLGRSNVIANLNNIAKDHQFVQSLFVSNQRLHAQLPIFDFTEMGSLIRSSGGLHLVEKGISHGMSGVVEARGSRVVKDEDEEDDYDGEFDDDDDDEFDDGFVDELNDDDDDDDDDGDEFDDVYYKKKF